MFKITLKHQLLLIVLFQVLNDEIQWVTAAQQNNK